ncbi:MAG: hypothetical protein U9N09_00330 [Euryarchaeota archaeon]|nr:hypothetical protein [Euryarchaeota archaeon]
MDGAIVTVAHDEFRGMGLSGVRGFMDEGVRGGWEHVRLAMVWGLKKYHKKEVSSPF